MIDRQERAFEQCVNRDLVISAREFDRRVDQLKSTSGLAPFNSSTRFCTAAATLTSLAPFAADVRRRRPARHLIARKCALGDRVGDDAEITEAHFAADRQADHRSGQIR